MPKPAEPMPSIMPVMVDVARAEWARPRSAGQTITRKVLTLPMKKPRMNNDTNHVYSEKFSKPKVTKKLVTVATRIDRIITGLRRV